MGTTGLWWGRWSFYVHPRWSSIIIPHCGSSRGIWIFDSA